MCHERQAYDLEVYHCQERWTLPPPTGGVNISPTVIILGQVPDYSRTFLQFSIYCLFRVCNLSDVIPAVSEPAHLVAHERTQHSIVVRPTAVRAILTDIICQTIVQHCRAPDLELTATCCVKLRLSLSLLSNPECTMEVAIVLAVWRSRQGRIQRRARMWW